MKFIKTSWMSLAGVAATLAPLKVFAQGTNPFNTANTMVTQVQSSAGLGTTSKSLPVIIGSIINVLLGFLGIVFLILMIWAGFIWMLARGDEDKVSQAVSMIRQAVIGLVIVIAAFAISNFVLGSLVNVTQ